MNRYIALQKIIELGSFTKAADALGYTQSSISQMIASLENELAIKLLTRSRVGVKLTIEGAELYPYIERSIISYRAMQEKANEIKGLETGIIRVGTVSSVTCHWMPVLIRGFQELYPHVQFLFHQGDYTTIPEWIRTGAVDFGFITPAAAPDLKTVSEKPSSCRWEKRTAERTYERSVYPIGRRTFQRAAQCFSRSWVGAEYQIYHS